LLSGRAVVATFFVALVPAPGFAFAGATLAAFGGRVAALGVFAGAAAALSAFAGFVALGAAFLLLMALVVVPGVGATGAACAPVVAFVVVLVVSVVFILVILFCARSAHHDSSLVWRRTVKRGDWNSPIPVPD